jgi:hypothetical protein
VPRSAYPPLTASQLGRATLARQSLLERSHLDPVAAIERIGGIQAQEPASPYLALWTRLVDFDASSLDAAFARRTVVKATLMRTTLHVVSADDFLALRAAITLREPGIRRPDRVEPLPDADLARLIETGIDFSAEPRTLGELRDHLAGQLDGKDPEELVWWFRRRATLVHAPSDVAWSFARRPRLVAASSWLDGRSLAAPAEAVEHLARRYLAAFGPATAADLAAWSGMTVASVRPGIEAIEAAGELRRFSDERGRTLLDLEGAPLPPADTPAPPRLLPMWESSLLAFADRTRIVSDADRALVIAANGDTLPSFLVDGRVAGLWWAEQDAAGRTRIVLEPFRRLATADRRALEGEGERLAAFVEPLEPTVYARYRRTRARRTSRA